MIDGASILKMTDDLLRQSPDPAMIEVREQLALMAAGRRPTKSVGSIVAKNYEHQDNPEVRQWADAAMQFWHAHSLQGSNR